MTDNSELCVGLPNVNNKRSACPWIADLGSLCTLTIELNFAFTFEKISLARAVSADDLTRGENNSHAIVAAEIRFGLVIVAGGHYKRIGIRLAEIPDVVSPAGDHMRLPTVRCHNSHPLSLCQHVAPLPHRRFRHYKAPLLCV